MTPRKVAQSVERWLVGALLLGLVVNGFFPFVWMLLTSLKFEGELRQVPITYLPRAVTLTNYVSVFTDNPFERFFLNSLIVAGSSTVLCILIAALAGYALARLRTPGQRYFQVGIVAVSMFPIISLMVPLYKIFNGVGLLNTYPALIIPYVTFSLPIATLVLIAFFRTIPRDLEDAAAVDGCSRLGTLWRVIAPLSAPGLVTAGIIVFVNSWNEFILALTLSPSQAMRTIPVGVTQYQSEFAFPWPVISAAIVLAVVPIVLLIVIFQHRVISGLTAGAVKG